MALVIGNSSYGDNIGFLKNPVNDAILMAHQLKASGFAVTLVTDADQRDMKRAIRDFGAQLREAGRNGIGLFFFAGHGVQVSGGNYLIPLKAEIEAEADVDIEAVSANGVLTQMAEADTGVNIIILDACRNNPFARGFRSITRGLARMDAPTGSILAYSTAPGMVAADGDGKNSPYTSALSRAMRKPGAKLEDVFKSVRVAVMERTSGQQVPWESSSLTGDFFFAGQQQQTAAIQSQPTVKPAPVAPAVTPPTPAATAPGTAETAFWQSVEEMGTKSAFEAYLSTYPEGLFAPLAKIKVASLSQQSPPSPPTPEPAPAPAASQEPEPEIQSAPNPAPEETAALSAPPARWKVRWEALSGSGSSAFCAAGEFGETTVAFVNREFSISMKSNLGGSGRLTGRLVEGGAVRIKYRPFGWSRFGQLRVPLTESGGFGDDTGTACRTRVTFAPAD